MEILGRRSFCCDANVEASKELGYICLKCKKPCDTIFLGSMTKEEYDAEISGEGGK